MAAGFYDFLRGIMGWWSRPTDTEPPIETHCFAVTKPDSYLIETADSYAITGTADATVHSEC